MENMYQICFYGGLILAIALFVLTVILFFVLRIPHTIGELTGSNARKSIKGMSKGASKTLSQSVTKKEQAKYYNVGTGKITVKEAAGEQANSNSGEIPSEEETEVLGAGRLAPSEEVTEVLGAGRFAADEDATDVLIDTDEEATAVLSSKEFDNDAATDVLTGGAGEDEATDVLATEGESGDEATDVLTTDYAGGDEATDILTGNDGFDNDAATDVLTGNIPAFGGTAEKPQWEAKSAGRGINNPKIRVITNVIVVNTEEKL